MVCLAVARVTRLPEGCQVELRLIVLAITENDASTELKCVTQNRAGRQEVVTHLQLEGEPAAFVTNEKSSLAERVTDGRGEQVKNARVTCLSPQTPPSRG